MEEVVPLHTHTEFLEACTEILNKEWPRSNAARLHSFSKSCDTLPVCLAFVRRDFKGTEVLGFSKLSAVQGISNAALAESVIVKESGRGQGLGRKLMELSEVYAIKLGIQTMYLNTLDKEGFYTRVGYKRCQPVISLGANAHRIPEGLMRQFMNISLESNGGSESQPAPGSKNDSNTPSSKDSSSSGDDIGACGDINSSNSNASTQQQSSPSSPLSTQPSATALPPLSAAPPPPPSAPPPPPPPPPPQSVKTGAVTLNSKMNARTIMRMDPNALTWMKKDLR